MTAVDYINELLSYEEYSFSLEEIQQRTSKSIVSLKRELSRLVEKKEVINLRKGFYLILPPRYRSLGQLPIELYVEKFFKYLNKNYYLALYTAAKFHGASHQQIQKEYIITSLPPGLNINKGSININFFTTANWPANNIIQKKADAGYYNISSPVLTAVDLIHYQTKLGGLNRMLATLEELTEEISRADLSELLIWYPHRSTLQRLGFLLEEIQTDHTLTDRLFDHLKINAFYPVVLSPKKGQKAGATGNRWKVDVNLKLESDL